MVRKFQIQSLCTTWLVAYLVTHRDMTETLLTLGPVRPLNSSRLTTDQAKASILYLETNGLVLSSVNGLDQLSVKSSRSLGTHFSLSSGESSAMFPG